MSIINKNEIEDLQQFKIIQINNWEKKIIGGEEYIHFRHTTLSYQFSLFLQYSAIKHMQLVQCIWKNMLANLWK